MNGASGQTDNNGPAVDTIAGLVASVLAKAGSADRYMIGVAGPPASGKSTTAAALVEAIRASGETAAAIPMDGFHYDDAVLEEIGLRSRKGSPPTFDVAGFRVLLERLRAREDRVAIPHFDRSLELSRAAAELVPASTRFLVIEGNYLLLNESPWLSLRSLFDLTVYIEVPIEELDRRLVTRWDFYGRDRQEARNWIDSNDMPNIRHVLVAGNVAEYTVQADLIRISG